MRFLLNHDMVILAFTLTHVLSVIFPCPCSCVTDIDGMEDDDANMEESDLNLNQSPNNTDFNRLMQAMQRLDLGREKPLGPIPADQKSFYNETIGESQSETNAPPWFKIGI